MPVIGLLRSANARPTATRTLPAARTPRPPGRSQADAVDLLRAQHESPFSARLGTDPICSRSSCRVMFAVWWSSPRCGSSRAWT